MNKHIIIKKANNVIDVFHGQEGWEKQDWTRFLLVKGFLKYINGAQMSTNDFFFVKKELGL